MTITKKALENPNDGYFERVYEMLDDLEKNEAVKNEPSPKEAGQKNVNIPVPEYRQSGKTETEVPEYWKPPFRKIGNRHRVPARC